MEVVFVAMSTIAPYIVWGNRKSLFSAIAFAARQLCREGKTVLRVIKAPEMGQEKQTQVRQKIARLIWEHAEKGFLVAPIYGATRKVPPWALKGLWGHIPQALIQDSLESWMSAFIDYTSTDEVEVESDASASGEADLKTVASILATHGIRANPWSALSLVRSYQAGENIEGWLPLDVIEEIADAISPLHPHGFFAKPVREVINKGWELPHPSLLEEDEEELAKALVSLGMGDYWPDDGPLPAHPGISRFYLLIVRGRLREGYRAVAERLGTENERVLRKAYSLLREYRKGTPLKDIEGKAREMAFPIEALSLLIGERVDAVTAGDDDVSCGEVPCREYDPIGELQEEALERARSEGLPLSRQAILQKFAELLAEKGFLTFEEEALLEKNVEEGLRALGYINSPR